MNIRTKRIIAKEIIYFVTLFFCVFIIWAIVEIWNSYLIKKQEKIDSQITAYLTRIDSLQEKILPDERRNQMQENLPKMIENGVWVEDCNRYIEDLRKKFGDKAVLEEMEILKENVIKLDIKRLNVNSKYINNSFKDGFTKWSVYVLLTILYPIRFICIALRWSFRILKENPSQ